jgi:hypothetical protein
MNATTPGLPVDSAVKPASADVRDTLARDLLVLLETAAKPSTSVDALKLVADLELVIQTHVMRDLPPAEKKAFMIAKWSVPSVPAVRCHC